MTDELRVLLVEDSVNDARLIQRTIEKGGYTVSLHRVETAAHMADAIETQIWDIVISDYSLPTFSGMEALALVQSTNLDLPFIMVSGVMGEDIAVETMRAGAYDYLIKDNLTRLCPAIERALQEATERRKRKQAEDQAHMLSRALAQSASLVLITDVNHRIKYVNETFCYATGYSREEILHTPVESFVSIASQDLAQVWQQVTHSGRYRTQLQSQRKDGTTFWVDFAITPVRTPGGTIQEYLIIQEDITHRKRLEAEVRQYTEQLEQLVQERTDELRQAHDDLEIIMNHTHDAIILTQPSGDIQKRNPAFDEIFGEKVRKSIEEIIHALSDEATVEPFARHLLGTMYDNENARFEAEIHDKMGRRVDVDLTLIPIPSEQGNLNRMLMTLHDITRIKEAERYKSRFVANAAHDLASPVSVMKTQIYILRQRPEQVQDRLEIIEYEVQRLEHLIDELTILSQLDQGKSTLTYEPYDLNLLVGEAVAARQETAQHNGQTLDIHLTPGLSQRLLDRQKMARAIVNLIDNAIRYTPEGGEIIVQTYIEPNSICLQVQDTGIGIPADELPYIFQRFYRSSQARQMVQSGSGLGLAIVREIIELHDGFIEVVSQPDRGTTFKVSLPVKSHD